MIIDGEIFAVGEPELEQLILFLRQKVEQKNSIVGT